MKNKKLFAILTLVCFMFTLMPVAAFAAGPEASLNKTYVTTAEAVTVTVTGADTSTHSQYVYALDSKGELYTNLDATGEYRGVAPISGTLSITFPDAGNYEVFVVDVANALELQQYISGQKYTGMDAYVEALAEAEEIEFDGKSTVRVKATENTYQIKFYEASVAKTLINVASDNGFSATGEVVVELLYANNDPVKYEDITFTTNSGYVTVEKLDAETDKNGKMEIKVAATKAGDYKVYAKYGDTKVGLDVHAAKSADAAGVSVVAEPKTPVALGDNFMAYTGIAFKFVDANGTVMDAADLGAAAKLNPLAVEDTAIIDGGDMINVAGATVDTDEAAIKVTVVEAPADSIYLGQEIGLRYDGSVNDAWTLFGGSFDEEGKYTFKVSLANGASATASVVVKEFGEPVAMKLIYNQDTVGVAGQATVKAVTLLDANYTAKTIFNGVTGYAAGYSNADLVFVANGVAVKDCVEDSKLRDGSTTPLKDGTIDVKAATDVDDVEKIIGTKISAMVIYDELELVATAELEVVAAADALKYVEKTADIAVNNELDVVVVDAAGNEVDVNFVSGDALKVYVLDAPENAVYDVQGVVNDAADEAYVRFTASTAGEYKLQTVLTYSAGYLTSVDTITVGGTAGTFEDVVVMSINANNIVVNSDVKAIAAAPMIKDGRTFVPFRALAEAFGAEVEWVEATQSVVAELNGVKVVMNIGANAYTVNGAAKTADVAPFINGASTMVPVRFVAEAFGITVTPLYAADGTVADVLFAK